MAFIFLPPVSNLLTLGDVRGGEWIDYSSLGLTDAHVPDLIRMIQDGALHEADSEGAEVWAPIHAWRALGQLRAETAVKPLVQLLTRIDKFDDDWVQEEIHVVLGMIGSSAIAPLEAFLATPTNGLWARSAAASSLEEIGKKYPESRDVCVAVLTNQLKKYHKQEPEFNASLVASLISLKAVESAEVVKMAYLAKKVDLSVCGDWEEVQIDLGLLSERQTPPPRGGWVKMPFLSNLQNEEPPPLRPQKSQDELREKRRLAQERAKQQKAKLKRQKRRR